MNIKKIYEAIHNNNIEWRKHSLQRLFERNITREDIKNTILNGEIIEYYPNDKPFPSCLFYYLIKNRPIHVVISFDESNKKVYIITTYEPTSEFFENDYKSRKKP